MHYAAAARDGGHYLKILGKAGADPMAVDNVSFNFSMKKKNFSLFTGGSNTGLLSPKCGHRFEDDQGAL